MSWFKKKLKKITKVVDPIGAKLRKSTGGSYGDPMNWYQSKPKQPIPYQRPSNPGLHPNPGTGGPTINFGGGGEYTPNPFANQMAQADALRTGQSNMAVPIGNVQMPGIAPQGMGPGPMPQQGPPQNNMMRPGGRPPGMAF